MPTAPVPAQRSRNRAPSILGARILNNVSRKRSEVGRVASEVGLFNFRLRYLPAMIRMALYRNAGALPPLGDGGEFDPLTL